MNMKRTTILTLFCMFLLQGFAYHLCLDQEKKPRRIRKYETRVESFKQQMQAMNLPQFSLTTCPEEFKDFPAVILADYDSLSFTCKKTFIMPCVLPILVPMKDYKSTHFHRTRILLNDDSAVERFSNFDYHTDDRARWSYGTLELSTLSDIHIRKADGTIRHVDLDSIYMPEAKWQYRPNEKRTLKIDGLEKGDIIDISSCNISNNNLFIYRMSVLEPAVIPMETNLPIVSIDSRVHTDKKLSTLYRTTNNAPEFTVDDSAEDHYLLSVHRENLLPASGDCATILLQPNVLSKSKYSSEIEKKPGIYANPPIEDVLSPFFFQEREKMKNIQQGRGCNFGKDSLAIFAHVDDIAALPLSQKEKADSIHRYLSETKPWRSYYIISGTLTFLEYFGCLLAKAHIPFDYGIVSKRANEPASQMLGSNYSTFLRLSDGSAVYFPYWGQQEEPLGKAPERFKGRQAILTDLKTTFILE